MAIAAKVYGKGEIQRVAKKASQDEKNAADILEAAGYRGILRDPGSNRHPDTGDSSDLVLDGQDGRCVLYDIYTPVSSSATNVYYGIAAKNDQARGIVVDLRNTSLSVQQITGGDIFWPVHC
jgi:hypothetical protein